MNNIDELLKFDALSEAEKITGTSYKDTMAGEGFANPAVGLGFLLMQENATAKEAALRKLGDTVFDNELARYQLIIERYGFEQVLADQWQASRSGVTETFFIYAHRKGLLLEFDTFGGTRVNGGAVYYQWRPDAALENFMECTSSGSMAKIETDRIWVGSHDCREGLIHNLNKLNNRGEFVTPWVPGGWLWLLNYDESKVPGYDYKAITKARVRRLPEWVQEFIGDIEDHHD